MPAPPLTRQVQEDFSAGMFRSGAAEHIPPSGSYDILNGLLDHTGGTFKRGGCAYRSPNAFGTGIRFIWDGWLANGQATLVGAVGGFGKVNAGEIAYIGGTGMTTAGKAAVYEGKIYFPGGFTYDGTTGGTAAKISQFYAVAGNRLLVATGGSRIDFSEIGKPDTFKGDNTNFHQIPGGVEILGLEGLRSSCAVFTTAGVWLINGLTKNLTDEAGNVQQSLDLYSQELILWGNGGIAGWEGSLIVPGTEGVYLLSLGVSSEKPQSFVRISDPIVDLYQEYVREGFSAGQATVYKNHYILPIIGGSEVADLLVCRLDLPNRPWTHLQGMGAKVGAVATRVVSGFSRTPELLGGLYSPSNSKLLTLSYFEPNANSVHDADGSTPSWSHVTRSYATGNIVPNTITKARLRYQLEGPSQPKIQAQSSSESEAVTPQAGQSAWGAFTWGTGHWATSGELHFENVPGEAPPSLDGTKPYSWHMGKKRRYVRFRFTCPAATSKINLHSLEVFIRPEGRI